MVDSRYQEEVKKQFMTPHGQINDALSIDNSIAALVRWRKLYKYSCTGFWL